MNQAYESASFVRCVVPETADIQAASAAVAANPESGDAWMKKGHALAKVSMMREGPSAPLLLAHRGRRRGARESAPSDAE